MQMGVLSPLVWIVYIKGRFIPNGPKNKKKNWSAPRVVSSGVANWSRLSVQKVALAGAHTHGGVWVNLPGSHRNSELPGWLRAPFKLAYVRAKIVGLAGLAESHSHPVHRYLTTR